MKSRRFADPEDKSEQQRLLTAIRGLPINGDIKKSGKGQSDYRLRVGDTRIVYAIDHTEKVVYVKRIDSRGGIYK